MSSSSPRRFIAGAVCPRCGEMDTVRMVQEGEEQLRDCVRCGYEDKLDSEGRVVELGTRVNQPRAGEEGLAHEADVQVLNLGDD
jgi:uncharacterized metal-binding protein (TIGR02443 family)